MQVSVDSIKSLREKTGAGIMDCKRALQETSGDLDKAVEFLTEQGIAAASKKASRETNQGVVDSYIHSGGRIGAMIELNCETDFVARTDDFKELAHNLAMQIAAMAPMYLDDSDIPSEFDGAPEDHCLMQQSYIKDPAKTVQDLVTEAVAKLGENVRVRRFSRFTLGG